MCICLYITHLGETDIDTHQVFFFFFWLVPVNLMLELSFVKNYSVYKSFTFFITNGGAMVMVYLHSIEQ